MAIQIGTILDMVGSPDNKWLPCNGAVYAQSSYPNYVTRCASILHPEKWCGFVHMSEFNSVTVGFGAIGKMGSTIVLLPQSSASTDVWYSTDDGDTWNVASNAMPYTASWILCSNNGTRFVALAATSNLGAYSTDGISWTGFTMPASAAWRWLEWGGNVFMAVPYVSNATIYYSSDGTSFSAGATFGTGVYPWAGSCKGHDDSNQLIWLDSNFKIRKSSNGTSLSTSTNKCILNPDGGGTSLQNNLVRLNGRWWGNDNQSPSYFYSSTDGEPDNWSKHHIPTKERYMSYFTIGRAPFWTGEEYVFLDCSFAGYDHWVTDDGVWFSPRFNSLQEIIDAEFISKEKGALVLFEDGRSIRRVCRLNYSDYDYTTHFQVPTIISQYPGMQKYIKVL